MAEETSTTVKSTSDGMVKITLEAYQDLQAKAAEKPAVIHRHVTKTPEVSATENKLWGMTFMSVGAVMFVVGAVRFKIGFDQFEKLSKK